MDFNDDPVRQFYTAHPYPPPVDNLDRARDEWRGGNRHRAEFHLLWPDKPYRADLDILVAGCGTWQSAKYAITRPAASVAGIDVSPTSVEHTSRLKEKYDLRNLVLRQLPLERVRELERSFDLIVCTGVLHHLADPDAGLAALRSVLKPDGAMYLMVYAPYGRTGVYMLQEYCRRLGIGTSDQDIRDLALALQPLPQSHPLASLLRGSRDAQNADALADALLNPRDRSYAVPQFLDFLDRNGLVLSRWNWQAPYLPHCGAIATTPHARRLADLPLREQYAALELWRGTMASHSAIARRNDAGDLSAQPRFDDEAWRRYVPIRLPWTQLVRERLPPGAAGALLNRSHPFHDLVLMLDAEEKRLFDGIDGRSQAGEVAARTTPDRARGLFQRLWWYDQVVYDMSNSR